jgi:hypothetical protein
MKLIYNPKKPTIAINFSGKEWRKTQKMNIIYNPKKLSVFVNFKGQKSTIYVNGERLDLLETRTRYSFNSHSYFVKIDKLANNNHYYKSIWYKHSLSEYYFWRKYEGNKKLVPIWAAGYLEDGRFFIVQPHYHFEKDVMYDYDDENIRNISDKAEKFAEKYGIYDDTQAGIIDGKFYFYDYAMNEPFEHIREGKPYNLETGEEL